ncbi:MAG: pseudouridine synthase, partial [Odoribacteraceae bacterium]|nr:pseudouridine synthase [Odoribacteraceae bacterium]
MEERAGKRPRIIRSTENRDENRWNREQNPDDKSAYRPGRPERPYREAENRDRYDGSRDGDRDNRRYGRDESYPRRDYNRRDEAPERNFNRYDEGPERNFNRHDAPPRDYNRQDAPRRDYDRHDAPRRDYDRQDAPRGGYQDRDSRPYPRPRWQDRDDDRSRDDRGERRPYPPRSSYDSYPRPYAPAPRPRWRDADGSTDQDRSNDRRDSRYYDDRRPAYRSNDRRDDYRPRRDDRDDRPYRGGGPSRGRGIAPARKRMPDYSSNTESETTELRLNRYIAKGGVCSRRDADGLIQAGRVKVNDEVVQQVGTKVQRTDKVEVDDVQITPERKVYLLLNKPKDYVTTLDDPMERKTVMKLIEGACEERIYPVGRLDRQTTGVLLFTN